MLAEIMLVTEECSLEALMRGERLIATVGTCMCNGFFLGIRYAEEMRKREVN
jgi:hypothetical protein